MDKQAQNRIEQLFQKLDDWVDESAGIDYHHKVTMMCNYALMGRVINIRNSEEKIKAYFTYSPEVLDYIDSYSSAKLLNFFERILRDFVYSNA